MTQLYCEYTHMHCTSVCEKYLRQF